MDTYFQLPRIMTVKAPKLIRFYEAIHQRYKWGHIPTEPRPKLPTLINQSPRREPAKLGINFPKQIPDKSANPAESINSAHRSSGNPCP